MAGIFSGASWANPIWFGWSGRWRIYQDKSPVGEWAFVHDDYDGAEDSNDNRHGVGKSLEDCIAQIMDMEA